jgi:hypothetical protein
MFEATIMFSLSETKGKSGLAFSILLTLCRDKVMEKSIHEKNSLNDQLRILCPLKA